MFLEFFAAMRSSRSCLCIHAFMHSFLRFKESLMGVLRTSRMFHKSFKGVSIMFQGCYKEVVNVFKGGFEKVLRFFQGSFM